MEAVAGTQRLGTDSVFRRICVFCGSSSGNKSVYIDAAVELGNEFVQRKINLVYGGGSIGLMGKIAETVHAGGSHVTGVIPKALMPREICGETVGEMIAVDDMHQRKAEMARLADAFIALPGGYGTLEELLEITTWSQLGIHAKPVGILNVNGYYDTLLALFDKAVEDGFLTSAARLILVSAPTARELIQKMETFSPAVDKNIPQLVWDELGPKFSKDSEGYSSDHGSFSGDYKQKKENLSQNRRRFPSLFPLASDSTQAAAAAASDGTSFHHFHHQQHHPINRIKAGRHRPLSPASFAPSPAAIKVGRVFSVAAAAPGAAAVAGAGGISSCCTIHEAVLNMSSSGAAIFSCMLH